MKKPSKTPITRRGLFAGTTYALAQCMFALVLTAGAGSAMAADAAAPLKIAVLDMAGALFNTDKAKAMDEQIRSETSDDEQKVRSLATDATTLQDKLKKDSTVMSDAEKRKANDQIQEIGVQYQYLVQKIQKLLDERRQEFQQTYAPNLIQVITDIVKEENYDLVIRSEAVLHYRQAYDITAQVTEKLNKQL